MASVCANCAAQLERGAKFCGACGRVVETAATPLGGSAPAPKPLPIALRGRYPALRIITVLLKILAVLTAIGGVISGLSAASLPNSLGIGAAASAIAVVILLASLCYALFLWASAEMIRVLIDIEENTRRSAGFGG
jgi:quaternary ammonium compound-resistance protein SugE